MLVAVLAGGIAVARVCWLVLAAAGELRGYKATPTASSVVARNLVTRRATAASILSEHSRYFHNTSIKMSEGTSIAILSGHRSWRESFRLARRNAQKFSHIAPVWFEVRPDCSAIDAAELWPVRALFAWLLRDPSRALTPVFSFRHIKLPADNRTHGQLAERLARQVARRCGRWCDGAVVDAHVALHSSRASSAGREFANAFVRALSGRLRSATPPRELLIAVPAYSDAFGKDDVAQLGPYVDKVIVQAFGFSSAKRPGPDAPLPWMMHALQGLVPSNSESARKLVASVRLGGSDFREPQGGARLCNRTRYFELLRVHDPRLDWYAEASEHVFSYVDEANASHSVYHPSLKSLHDRLGAIRSWGVGVAVEELHCGLDYFMDLW